MNGNTDPGPAGKESSDDAAIGAAIETLTVRDLEADVEASRDGVVRLNLRHDSSDGRTAAAVWCRPDRARDLAAELLQKAGVAEQYLAEIEEEEADTEGAEA